MTTDPDRELADLAAQQHGVFTRDDARRAKLSETQIKLRIGTRWSRLHDGVFLGAAAPRTWRGDLLAATLAAGTDSAISHRSAAALYDLPGGSDDLVEVSCIRWKRTIQSGLIVHESRRLNPTEIRRVDGIPVTCPERTILDIASCFPRAGYLEYVVQAARRKRLITYASTKEMFDRHARRGLKGVRALREVLEAWDPSSRPTESEMETLLIRVLRENGLPEPVVQFEVSDSAGRFVARVDAAYPDSRIAIEYDSKQEHSDEFQIARNDKRRNALQTNRYWVLSARHRDLLTGGGELCDQITAIMRRENSELA